MSKILEDLMVTTGEISERVSAIIFDRNCCTNFWENCVKEYTSREITEKTLRRTEAFPQGI